MEQSNENKKVIATILVVFLIIVGTFGIALLSPDVSSTYEVKTFSSYDDLKNFLGENLQQGNYYGWESFDTSGGRSQATLESNDDAIAPSVSKSDGIGSNDFSETNIQVEGVDEPDIVKTDGTYIYLVSDGTVYIVQAYPGETASIISTITLDENVYINNIFINSDSLIIFGGSYRTPYYNGIPENLLKGSTGIKDADVDIGTDVIIYDQGDTPEEDTSPENDSYEDAFYENETNGSEATGKSEPSIEDTDDDEIIAEEPMLIEPEPYYYDYWWDISSTIVKVYDINNRNNPDLVKEVELDGNYYDARMIGEYIYIISTEYTYEIYRQLDEENVTLNIPQITINNKTTEIPYNKIHYIDAPERMDTMTHIIALNLNNNDIDQESFMLGGSQNMYVSLKNIYLVYTQYDYDTFLPGEEIAISSIAQSYNEKTIIHKISIHNGQISYESKAEVPGHTLNQFSMDEHNGYFRIATTIGWSWDETNPSTNNVYILDEELNQISSIEDIAPGETIYSARFMGDRAYLVTFKNIDPFFTLDLSDPYNPQILGELKIPGYSDYLHPYDENHIIGIGKDAVEPVIEFEWTKNFAWYQGVKIAIFDVTDFENPQVLDQVIIGDRGTDSPALHNHKAFLFDKEKELLVIPVSLYEIDNTTKNSYNEDPGSTYGTFTFQGAYVYNLNLDGFTYKGRITHLDKTDFEKEDYYYRYWGSTGSISRSLYINDILYTISDKMIKMNDLVDLAEINSVELE